MSQWSRSGLWCRTFRGEWWRRRCIGPCPFRWEDWLWARQRRSMGFVHFSFYVLEKLAYLTSTVYFSACLRGLAFLSHETAVSSERFEMTQKSRQPPTSCSGMTGCRKLRTMSFLKKDLVKHNFNALFTSIGGIGGGGGGGGGWTSNLAVHCPPGL